MTMPYSTPRGNIPFTSLYPPLSLSLPPSQWHVFYCLQSVCEGRGGEIDVQLVPDNV